MTQYLYYTAPGGLETPLAPPSIVPQADREGFDSIEAELFEARAPYQDGATPLGGAFVPREIFLPLVIAADSAPEMAALRRGVTRLFAPNRGVGILRWVQDDGTSWVIRCEPRGGVAFGQADRFSARRVRAEVTLVAKDPFWYDPTVSTVSVGLYEGGWSLPLSFPLTLGAMTGVAAVQNDGDVATPCTVTLTGPITSPVIANETTGDQWSADLALYPGEQLIVSSVFGSKSAVRFDPATGVSVNAFGAVRPDSRWIELVPGENRVGFTRSAAAPNAQMEVAWFNRYLGA